MRNMSGQLANYIERAPQRAQEHFRVWLDTPKRTPEFSALLGKTFTYWDSKRSADAYRACEVPGAALEALREEAETKEKEARLAFAWACMEFDSLNGLASN